MKQADKIIITLLIVTAVINIYYQHKSLKSSEDLNNKLKNK